MKNILIIILLNLAIAGSVLGQIDTLALVEITNIQTSSEIRELYIEDLNGDSLKEIIICTENLVQVFNSQNYQPEWTSPELNMPTDLLFTDINGDGYSDISLKDSSNIYLYDIHNQSTLWISPEIDSTYKCFTVGDRNDDDIVDVAIASKEPFTRSGIFENMDTVWVKFYNGPSFQYSEEFIILMNNYYFGFPNENFRLEEPSKILIYDLTTINQLTPNIIIFSDLHQTGVGWSGSCYVYEGDNLSMSYSDTLGKLDYYDYRYTNESAQIYFITCHPYWNTGHINLISGDSTISYNASQFEWVDFVFGDLNYSNQGNEICFEHWQAGILYLIPEFGSDTIWASQSTYAGLVNKYSCNMIFTSPQILCFQYYPDSCYVFYSGSDGEQTAMMFDPGFEITEIDDLDNDGIDIIFSVQGSSLHIYDLDYATDINERAKLPGQFSLSQNHPNPFNATTSIKYDLPKPCDVTIEIYDILGRRVKTLVREKQQSGHHSVAWNAGGLSSGMYFYRIQAGEFAETKKMLLLK